MAERADPKDPAFKHSLEFRLRRGFIPWVSIYINPYRREFFWRYRWARRYCRGKDVLDVPCGTGWGSSLLRNARSVTGVDVSESAIDTARSTYSDLHFVIGEMAHLPCPDASFDVVLCLEGIEHVSVNEGTRFITEAARVLRPGGHLLISTPHRIDRRHSGNPYHVKEYLASELLALIEEHFNPLTVHTRTLKEMYIHYVVATLRDGDALQ